MVRCVILVDAQRIEIPDIYIDIDISSYGKEVIAKKDSSRFPNPVE